VNKIEENDSIKATIFNIQHYSIHDGPGIRTSVFLKGCFLRCIWCQNPESQNLKSELFYFQEKCTGCGRCVEICPERAVQINNSKSIIDRTKCIGCGQCVQACPGEARSLIGKEMTVHEVFQNVKGDEVFYKRSNGGMTLTGGDPLFHPHFSRELLSLCRRAGIHTALETCGHADWETLKDTLQYVDLVLFDIKHMNPGKHQEYTGVSNDLILANARKIYHELGLPIWARIPVVPGYSDSIENIKATARFVAEELSPSVPVQILAYHQLGESKYERSGKNIRCFSITPPSHERMQEIKNQIDSYGLETRIGG
jgi:pyruvate formate lyase activating enzyme